MTDNGSGRRAGTSASQPGLATRNPATGARPVLVVNPLQDRAFAAAAEALLDDGLRSVPSFQEALRRRFADVVVRARDLSGETEAVWYLFRDGRWVNGANDSQPAIDG